MLKFKVSISRPVKMEMENSQVSIFLYYNENIINLCWKRLHIRKNAHYFRAQYSRL